MVTLRVNLIGGCARRIGRVVEFIFVGEILIGRHVCIVGNFVGERFYLGRNDQ